MKSNNRVCLQCKKGFYAPNWQINRVGGALFCSRKCIYENHKGKQTWNKGKKGTQKANKGSFKKGEHRSPDTEFYGQYSGDKHWNWKGGVTRMNASIRTSAEYKKWRKAVFERDNYTCVWCGAKNGNGESIRLEADHIKPFAYFPELRFSLENGRTLCNQCHKFTASYMGRLRRFTMKPKKFRPGIDRCEYGGAVVGAEEFDAVVGTILGQGGRRWTVGEESEAFERELAETAGVKRAVVTNSGSSSLLLAMTSLHLPKGSKVIIPATTFPTAYNVILQNGLIPVVIDVDYKTFNLSFVEVKRALLEHPDIKAVVAVDISGNPVDLIKLREVVGKDVIIVLDNCDGFGTKLEGKFIDSYADVSCVSFHAAHIITTGEGGAVLTNNEAIADAAKKLREWGRASGSDKLTTHPGFPEDYRERYVYEEIGFNIKPLELQCAMGRVQLRRLPEFMGKRAENHEAMKHVFRKYKGFFTELESIQNAEPCWMHYPFLVEGLPRGYIMDGLEKANIETRTVFSGNILKHPAYKGTEAIQVGTLENAEKIMRNGMFISVHPSLTQEMIDYIDKTLEALCSSYTG